MRQYIKLDILANQYYVDSNGRKNYSMIIDFLFSDEIDFIINVLGLSVKKITNNYNLIVFKNNFNEKTTE